MQSNNIQIPINVTQFINPETRKEFFTPERDIIFRSIFAKPGNENITRAFLKGVLQKEIEDLSLDANPEFMVMHKDDKQMISDVRAYGTQSRNIYLIEMQVDASNSLTKRFPCYSHKSLIDEVGLK